MGTDIFEIGEGGIIVRSVGAGSALGFRTLTPAYAISTSDRSAERDYVVLSEAEAAQVAYAILKDLLTGMSKPCEPLTRLERLEPTIKRIVESPKDWWNR